MSSLHQHAKDLFIEALARPAEERAAFLAEVCGTDLALRQEVDSLLAFHSEASSGDGAAEPTTVPIDDPTPFRVGDVWAGRYRMVARIGRGGMGDVWRADDMVLETPVALKLMHQTGPEARGRILHEVRLARGITHPSICRVFDVGEADGRVFFTMELVRGENLATLIARVGRLPSERVIQIGRQICEGLAAAHAQGVLHRDLKPANVLVEDSGRVLITDFGIAVSREERGGKTLIGTPGYMSPEQLTRRVALSERSDLYALGLVLFELVAGEHAFARSSTNEEPPRPSALVPDIDKRLDRVISKALATNPRNRPESASQMADMLASPAPLRNGQGTRRWLLGAGLAAAIAVIATIWSFVAPTLGPALTERDTIVVADFTNTTGEPVFDGTLSVALAVALEQSPFLKVFSDDRVGDTLRMMGHAPDTPVTRTIAREIAQREQLKALLAGSIARLGRNYVIAIEAVNAQSGDVVARQQVEVASKEEVLTALGSAVSRLRETLGESLPSIERFDTPLARATTPSLDALHAYSLALDQGSVNPRPDAIPHLQRALELDPDFALALAFMATVYSNNGETARAAEYATKAFAMRDRVSERERFFVAFRYYRDARGDWDQALELTRLWVASYPREAFAFNSLGTALLRFGQYEQSIQPFRDAIRLDPAFAPPYTNLVTALIAVNRFKEAREIIQQNRERGVAFAGMRRLSFTLGVAEGDTVRMAEQLEFDGPRDPTSYGWEGHALAFVGRVRAAHDAFRSGIQQARQANLIEIAGQMSAEDAEVHAIVGQCDEARREFPEAIALSRDNFTLERVSRAAALCGDDQAPALVRNLAERFPNATFSRKVAIPISEAMLAVTRRQPERALEILETVQPYDSAQRAELWPPYLRGLAHLQLGRGQAAADEFQRVLDRRGEDADSQLYALAHLGIGRATALTGDLQRSQAMYDAFLTLWSQADADLAPLVSARRERGQRREQEAGNR